jgi:hypothetical protein
MSDKRLTELKYLAERTTRAFALHEQHCDMSPAQIERAMIYFVEADMENELKTRKRDGVH